LEHGRNCKTTHSVYDALGGFATVLEHRVYVAALNAKR